MNGFSSMQSLSSGISDIKGGAGLILSLLQYKHDVITKRIIPWHAGIQYFDLNEDKVCYLLTCKFSSDSVL